MKLQCFKAYDIRGQVPNQLDVELVRKIGFVYGQLYTPRQVVVGRDNRLSSDELADALMDGLQRAGVDVLDLGQCGTENVYFAVVNQKLDGGIMVTASHNPIDYNGLKLVREQSRPISADTGLLQIRDRIEADDLLMPDELVGQRQTLDVWDAYIEHLLSYIDVSALQPLKVLVNPGNGGAGAVIERLQQKLPFEFIRMDFEADGDFPNGIPNPLLPENQGRTAQRVRQAGVDLGVAWDGDFDRCFLFDANGEFINGYYLVGLIAAELLSQHPGEKIVHDPRLTWNTIELVKAAGGEAILSQTGHSLFKDVMRKRDAIYGGEISGHHYFRDFAYCDSGMIPWLLITAIMSRQKKSLSELVKGYQSRFPASDEINQQVDNAADLIQQVEQHYRDQARHIDHTDGLSMEFDDWRFNLRMSNTEPLLRLNVETRTNKEELDRRVQEVRDLL